MELIFWLAIGLGILIGLKLIWTVFSLYFNFKRFNLLESRLEILEKRSPSDHVHTARAHPTRTRFINYSSLVPAEAVSRVAEL